MAPLFRADHIGSLIRPLQLVKAQEGAGMYQADEPSQELMQLTSAAIRTVVQKQLDLSVRPITSGEYERVIFYSGFFEKLAGMDPRDLPIPEGFHPKFPTTELLLAYGRKEFSACVATGKIRHVAPAYLSSWELLKKVVPEQHWKDCKISIPSPTWQHFQLAKGLAYTAESGYTSDREYLKDVAAAFRTELEILYKSGLRSVQVDDPHLTYFVLDQYKEGIAQEGLDSEELLDLYIQGNNAAIEGLPADLHIGIHLCRGNMPGSAGFVQGSYDLIAEKVFKGLNHQTFYLEFDDERSGGFECLKHLPVGKNIVLGLISTKQPGLEEIDLLESRVREAAGHIASGQGRTVQEVLDDTIAVSPQCGFASFNAGRGVASEDRMWEKLTLAHDLARRIWKDAE